MRKIVKNLFFTIFLLFSALIILLSTIGIETNRFNKLISDKASDSKNINLNLETIKFKINIKDLSLFLETQKPEISYKGVLIPVENIKVFVDFLSLLKSEPIIKKTTLILKELDIKQLNKLSIMIKPSNFKSLLNNKVREGKLLSEIEIFLADDGTLENFIAKGLVKGLKAEVYNDLLLTNTNLGFFADKNDVLLKNIFGNLGGIKISDGDIKLNFDRGIELNSNFNTDINLNEKILEDKFKFLKKFEFVNRIKNLKSSVNNNISIHLDKTYKVKDYKYTASGEIEKGNFEFLKSIKNSLLIEELKEIYLSDFKIKINFEKKNINFTGSGKYSFNNSDFLKINLNNNFKNNSHNLILNFDYKNMLVLDLINYKKSKDTIANLSLNLKKNQNNLTFNEINYEEEENSIIINGLVFSNNDFKSFKSIKVLTKYNDFSVKNGKKILIEGNKFDATNLSRFITQQNNKNSLNKNSLNKISNKIEINFSNIKVPMSEKLKDFKLIGEIKNGQFVKISSKGDFGGENYLDIKI